ncbi:MAG: YicC family protein [Planctomycetales bacterium]|nr:YicC family protein [Planctomycetales bacterium]
MTGFGEVRDDREGYAICVEVRTVNSRYLKLHLRTTEGYGSLETRLEKVIRERVKRGTIHCNVRIRHLGVADDFRLNVEVLNQYVDQLQALAAERRMSEDISLERLAGLPGVIEELSTDAHDAEHVWPLVEPTLRAALEQLGEMRAVEGQALATDLEEQCATVARALDVIETRTPLVVEHYRKRIQDRVNEALSSLNVSVEPADLVREVSLFADRADISEEIVRLRSHLQQFDEAMQLAESAGRKLEFICQEMGREANTIGSKANDAEISAQVVEIKTALERIREQIQNVQ